MSRLPSESLGRVVARGSHTTAGGSTSEVITLASSWDRTKHYVKINWGGTPTGGQSSCSYYMTADNQITLRSCGPDNIPGGTGLDYEVRRVDTSRGSVQHGLATLTLSAPTDSDTITLASAVPDWNLAQFNLQVLGGNYLAYEGAGPDASKWITVKMATNSTATATTASVTATTAYIGYSVIP